MKFWSGLIRTVGALSLVLALWGYYFQILAVRRVISYLSTDPSIPFFRQAFFTLTLIDAVFLAALSCIGVGLLKLRRKACLLYIWLVISIAVYESAVGGVWLLHDPVGRSVAAASGIGAVGVGPLLFYPVPFVYPVLSALLVYLAQRRLEGRDARAT